MRAFVVVMAVWITLAAVPALFAVSVPVSILILVLVLFLRSIFLLSGISTCIGT